MTHYSLSNVHAENDTRWMTHSFICSIDTIRWVTVSGIWFNWLIFYIYFLRGWGQVYLSLDWLTKILKKIIWGIDRSLHLLLKRLSFLWNYSLQTGRKDQVVSHCKDLFSVQSNNTTFSFPWHPFNKTCFPGDRCCRESNGAWRSSSVLVILTVHWFESGFHCSHSVR